MKHFVAASCEFLYIYSASISLKEKGESRNAAGPLRMSIPNTRTCSLNGFSCKI